MDKNFYSIKQAAGILGLSEETVRNKIRRGELQSSRLPTAKGRGQYRIPAAELLRILNVPQQ